MKDFRQLLVWSKSHELVKRLYNLTETFPKHELFGLTSQIRRAATSIPTNIAEGCGRGSDADFKRFVQISFGSACELEYLLMLSSELNFIPAKEYDQVSQSLIEVKKMLSSLIGKLK